MARQAVTSKIFPLVEVTDNGRAWKVWKDFEPTQVKDYIKAQGRFRHLGEAEIDEIQEEVDREWRELLSREHRSTELPGLDAG